MYARKRLLIVSNGPPPTADQPVVEGGGLRCWGLAWGLRRNDPELAITVAYHEHYRKAGSPHEQDGIALATWEPATLPALVGRFDAVLVSYCMGTLSRDIAHALRPDQRLILDCYVPIHVEVCARESRDVDGEYAAFHRDAGIWNEVLRRGDLMLYASPAQRPYYLGVLGANGRLNPLTYGEDLLLRVPYGIYPDPPEPASRPVSALAGPGDGKKILWFGGIYPWFDLRGLIDAVALVNRRERATLTIVGARNPFNTHPDFVARSDELARYASRPEFRGVVKLQDWVGFRERADWYCDADLVVVVNKPGDENALSWRTRLADFLWAGVPIVTNGGDPLGDRLIAAGASARFPSLDPEAIADTLHGLLTRPDELERLRSRQAPFRDELRWDEVTRPLAEWIGRGRRAADLVYEETAGHAGDQGARPVPGGWSATGIRGRRLVGRAARHVQDHGLRATATKVQSRLSAKLGGRAAKVAKRDPSIVVLSHQLDHSGAPYALMDVVHQMVNGDEAVGGIPRLPAGRVEELAAAPRDGPATPHLAPGSPAPPVPCRRCPAAEHGRIPGARSGPTSTTPWNTTSSRSWSGTSTRTTPSRSSHRPRPSGSAACSGTASCRWPCPRRGRRRGSPTSSASGRPSSRSRSTCRSNATGSASPRTSRRSGSSSPAPSATAARASCRCSTPARRPCTITSCASPSITATSPSRSSAWRRASPPIRSRSIGAPWAAA
ncbi:MAG: glycosyltransferase [Isosphaeraceae bacterium]